MTIRIRGVAAATAAVLALTIASPALAVDGVIEINQACATSTGGCTAGDTDGVFPVVIAVSGSYRLTSNLDLPTGGGLSAIVISSSETTVDLNGFTISGANNCTSNMCTASSSTKHGIDATGADAVSVKNGTVQLMDGTGISLGLSGHVIDVIVRQNGLGGIVASDRSVIANSSTVLNDDGAGLVCGIACRVEGVVSSANRGGNGILTGVASIVSGSTVEANHGDGIACTNCNVIGNSVHSNTLWGLNLSTSGYSQNVIVGNSSGNVTGSNHYELGTNLCGTNTICP